MASCNSSAPLLSKFAKAGCFAVCHYETKKKGGIEPPLSSPNIYYEAFAIELTWIVRLEVSSFPVTFTVWFENSLAFCWSSSW